MTTTANDLNIGTWRTCSNCGRLTSVKRGGDSWQCIKCGCEEFTGKPRMSLLPMDTLETVAAVLSAGAGKYPDFGWKDEPMPIHEDAMLRHYSAYKRGETTDHETGLPALAHMAARALMVLWHYEHKEKAKDE